MHRQGNDAEGKVCRVCILAVGLAVELGFTGEADE